MGGTGRKPVSFRCICLTTQQGFERAAVHILCLLCHLRCKRHLWDPECPWMWDTLPTGGPTWTALARGRQFQALCSLFLSSDPWPDSGSVAYLAPDLTACFWHRGPWLSVWTCVHLSLTLSFSSCPVLVPAEYDNLWNSATGDIWHRDHVPRREKIKALPRSDPALATEPGLAQQTGPRRCALSQGCGWWFKMSRALRKGNSRWQRLSTLGGCWRLLGACFQRDHL